MQALVDVGRVSAGERVLVNGAGGGFGTFAVQIAALRGAEATGVDRAEKLAAVRDLGAARVVDDRAEDFTRAGVRYDLIVDPGTDRSPFDYAPALVPGGRYATVGGDMPRLLQAWLLGRFAGRVGGQTLRVVSLRPNGGLEPLLQEIATGRVAVILDGTYALDAVPETLARFGSGLHVGKVVVRIGDGARAMRGLWFAFLDEVEPSIGALHGYAMKLTGNVWDAEDLVQDTLLRGFAMTARGDFHGPDSPVRDVRAYLFRTATNLMIDRARRSRRLVSGDADVAVPAAGDRRGRAPGVDGSRPGGRVRAGADRWRRRPGHDADVRERQDRRVQRRRRTGPEGRLDGTDAGWHAFRVGGRGRRAVDPAVPRGWNGPPQRGSAGGRWGVTRIVDYTYAPETYAPETLGHVAAHLGVTVGGGGRLQEQQLPDMIATTTLPWQGSR